MIVECRREEAQGGRKEVKKEERKKNSLIQKELKKLDKEKQSQSPVKFEKGEKTGKIIGDCFSQAPSSGKVSPRKKLLMPSQVDSGFPKKGRKKFVPPVAKDSPCVRSYESPVPTNDESAGEPEA